MQLTVATWDERTLSLEVDDGDSIATVSAILEAETGLPAPQQQLWYNGHILASSSKIKDTGLQQGDLLMLMPLQTTAQQAPPRGARGPGASLQMNPDGSAVDPAALMAHIVAEPGMMAGLRNSNPVLAAAVAAKDIEGFQTELRRAHSVRMENARIMDEREKYVLEGDPLDPEVQRRMEEMIQEKNIEENFAHAMEHSPEVFGQVHMLYVDMEVNGVPVKTFIDSGAQMTIMTYEFTQKCYLTRLIDKRFQGVAVGVGSSKIIGRIHQAPVRVQGHYITTSITVLEQKDGPQFIFGLDNLRRLQCSIDLADNALAIGTCNVRLPFLAEHLIPRDFREHVADLPQAEAEKNMSTAMHDESGPAGVGPSSTPSTAPAAPAPSIAPPSTTTAAPAPAPAPALPARTPGLSADQEGKVQRLMALGFDRQQVLEVLAAVGWNEEHAGALLFDV